MPKASWWSLAFMRKSAMLDDFTVMSSWSELAKEGPFSSLASSSPLVLPLLLDDEEDKFKGKIDRGSVKDELLLFLGINGGGGAAPWWWWGKPNKVFTSNELLKPDKNGEKEPPKAATTAAYWNQNKNVNKDDRGKIARQIITWCAGEINVDWWSIFRNICSASRSWSGFLDANNPGNKDGPWFPPLPIGAFEFDDVGGLVDPRLSILNLLVVAKSVASWGGFGGEAADDLISPLSLAAAATAAAAEEAAKVVAAPVFFPLLIVIEEGCPGLTGPPAPKDGGIDL